MSQKKSDMTSTISYCMWDTYALTAVLQKIKFLEDVKANVEIFNIPLSWALHKNATNWITMSMLRTFYKDGFAFSYDKYPMPAVRDKFLGATAEACPQELQMTVLDFLALGDFVSLYPSCFIAANCGIDSVLEQPIGDHYAVNVNFVDKYLMSAILDKVVLGERATKE